MNFLKQIWVLMFPHLASTLEEAFDVLPDAHIDIQLCRDHTFQISVLDQDGNLISSNRAASGDNLTDRVRLAVAMAVIDRKLRK